MRPIPRDRSHLTVDGAVGESLAAIPECENIPLDLLRLAIEMLSGRLVTDYIHELETLNVHDKWFLDILLSIAHKAHVLLQNRDPEIRTAAELLTDVTAHLIGRLYCSYTASLPGRTL